jgi:hypothetical protein
MLALMGIISSLAANIIRAMNFMRLFRKLIFLKSGNDVASEIPQP